MKRYPLSVPMGTYRGRDPAKRRKEAELQEVAELVVGYINMEMQQSVRDSKIFERVPIARAIQCDPELVGEVLMRIEGSDNGVIVCKETDQ